MEKLFFVFLRRTCYQYVTYTGGAEGVFDIDEICAILTGENAIDICCIQVPPDKPIADWIVLVSARSLRHLAAVAAFMNRLVGGISIVEVQCFENFVKLFFFSTV